MQWTPKNKTLHRNLVLAKEKIKPGTEEKVDSREEISHSFNSLPSS